MLRDADTLSEMPDLLVHWGALAFLIAAPVVGAIKAEIRHYRRVERGERISVTAD